MSNLLCVPNVSEGQREDVIRKLTEASQTAGVKLVDVHSDPDHNRSVLTLYGAPESLTEAVLSLAAEALEHIDIRKHEGVHPRMGALDVVPFTDAGSEKENEFAPAIDASVRTARRLWEELQIPSFLYEMSALKRHAAAVSLPEIRKHAFEVLAPDFGGPGPHPTAGATTVGARRNLVAYNIFLDSKDPWFAKSIASRLREALGGLRGVRALGFYLPSRHCTQISMNLFRLEDTTMADVYDQVTREAEKSDIPVIEAEVVGVCPKSALGGRDPASLGLTRKPVLLEEVRGDST